MIRKRMPIDLDYGDLAHPDPQKWSWRPTMDLRLKAGRLQQKWYGCNYDSEETVWRSVKEVPETEPDEE